MDEGPCVTTIIGPNGSGKSRALAAIADEFDLLSELRGGTTKRRRPSGARERYSTESDVQYQMRGSEVTIKRSGSKVDVRVDGSISDLEFVPFPSKVLAVAHLPWDRFRFASSAPGDFYNYLGLRQQTNLTTTGALEARVLQSMIRLLQNEGHSRGMSKWLDLMDLPGPVWVAFDVHPDFLQEKTITARLDALVERNLSKTLKSDQTGRPNPRFDTPSMREDIFQLFVLIESRSLISIEGRAGRNKAFTARIRASEMAQLGILQTIETARRAGLLSALRVELTRHEEPLPFSELSSGEQQLLGTASGILANLDEDTIVLIDEPEVSLHPSWQMNFLPTLLASLEPGPSCHIFLATHSHFMVSDVEFKNMSLLLASPFASRFEEFLGPVYGRSPENILYRVFGVGTAGNFYVESDIAEALRIVSGVQPFNRLKLEAIQRRLYPLVAEDNPALGIIWQRIASALRTD